MNLDKNALEHAALALHNAAEGRRMFPRPMTIKGWRRRLKMLRDDDIDDVQAAVAAYLEHAPK